MRVSNILLDDGKFNYIDDPDVSVFSNDVCEYPQGIEYYDDDVLIIACGDGLYRIDEDNPSISEKIVGTEFLNSLDGIAFNEDQSILYVVINGAYTVNNEPAYGSNKIAALSSSDEWQTADVLYIFNANCDMYPTFVPSAVTTKGGIIYVSCMSDDLTVQAPNTVKFIADAENKITNGNNIYGTNSEDAASDDGDTDDYFAAFVSVLVVMIVFFMTTVALAVILFRKRSFESTDSASSNLNVSKSSSANIELSEK
jgi:hypothetical protein